MSTPNALEQKHPFALIIIDVINHYKFKEESHLLEYTKKMAGPLKKLKERAKEQKVPVIYVNDHYYMWQADYHKIIDHCKNEENQEILETLSPAEDDFFLIKPKHSAFYESALHTLLRQLHVKNIIVTGVAGNISVLFTANEGYMKEYTIYAPADCIASNTKEANEFALNMMKNVLGADLTESSELTFTEPKEK
ncbi:isochorismatase family cysteine hydrolase [Bacillus testis]|uniref:isochorismatase family cysteine hydrolase n=1 Tax=Bacillus testis TaxID=1622072 RepID=UPI00067ED7DD|nr:isochorismatase family cysteine hydrolase [Bacillus testis]